MKTHCKRIVISFVLSLVVNVFGSPLGPLKDYCLNRLQVQSDSGSVTCYSDHIHLGGGSKVYLTVEGAGELRFRGNGYEDWFWCRCDDSSSVVWTCKSHYGYVDVVVNISGAGIHTIVWDTYSSWASSGWGDIANVRWKGNTIPLDPIPGLSDNPTIEQVQDALYGSKDSSLGTYISDGNKYNCYRQWADTICGSSFAKRQEVRDSAYAWLSFALNTDSLITKAPVQGEVSIGRFSPNADEAKAFDLDIAINGIAVGASATAANLANVFTIEGSTSPNGTYSSDDVEVTFGTPSNGKVKCTAKAKDATKTQFFMRVKMNP